MKYVVKVCGYIYIYILRYIYTSRIRFWFELEHVLLYCCMVYNCDVV